MPHSIDTYPMQTIAQRLDDLESKFSYQENTLDILNDVVLKQYAEIEILQQKIHHLSQRLSAYESRKMETINHLPELPPHY